ncbi:hypothetical protein [Xanthomonas euvesicatoria]|uniref:hypothetical protein n=1 Tax=Xanthomonas euvesicatoria TaxID=456327 RepID=UPI000F8CD4BF|nr:hypothetical protein [Xanthomonas euvesicatoria]
MSEYNSKNFSRKILESSSHECDPAVICKELVSAAFNDQDWKWVQEKCLIFLNDKNSDIRGVAATCLGHIARIHRKIEKDKVIGALRSRLHDPVISGRVEDALNDIEMFLDPDLP